MLPLQFALLIEPMSQLIRQRSDINGVTLTSGEQKLALFVDNLLISITKPTQTLPKLMSLLEEFGSVSGYKININKTQILTFNYNPPSEIKTQYNWNWDTESIRYLDVILPKDLSRLYTVNYGPLNSKIKSDLHRWNVSPFLNLSSRIETVRMSAFLVFGCFWMMMLRSVVSETLFIFDLFFFVSELGDACHG